MAPPTVFSYLRGQHRRNDSSPTSHQFGQWQTLSPPQGSEPGGSLGPARANEDESLPAPSPISPLPPTLPPIPRIASHRKTNPEDSNPWPSGSVQHTRAESHPQSTQHESSLLSVRAPGSSNPSNTSQSSQNIPFLPPIPRVTHHRHFGQDESHLSYQPFAHNNRQVQAQSQYHAQAHLVRARTEDATKHSEDSSATSHLQRFRAADSSVLGDRGTQVADRPTGLRKANETSNTAIDVAPRPSTPTSNKSYGDLHPPLNKSANSSPSPSSSLSSYQKQSATIPTQPPPASSQVSQHANNAPPKSSKARMLLNPMSLLMRRRTSHGTDPLTIETFNNRNLSVPAMSLPDDYDPRIKGKGVHDFSAPRPRRDFSDERRAWARQHTIEETSRNLSSRRKSLPSLPHEASGEDSTDSSVQRTPEREHTPVFFEDFKDTGDDAATTSAVHRESLANSSFLARWSKSLEQENIGFNYSNKTLPPDSHANITNHVERNSRNTDAPSWRTSSDQSTLRSSTSNETRGTSPPQSPQKPQSRVSSNLEPSPLISDPLRHIPSSASRFSFQMNNDSSAAQERALEEKHKQRVASKAIADAATSDRLDEESEEEDFGDYDDMDDGLEEPIPGVNVDADEDEDMTIIPFDKSVHATSGVSREMPDKVSVDQGKIRGPALGTQALINSLGLANIQDVSIGTRVLGKEHDAYLGTEDARQDDEMYFDDGVIEPPNAADDHEFDEDIFDLPTTSHYDVPQSSTNIPRGVSHSSSQGLDPEVTNSQPLLDSTTRKDGDDDEDYLNMARFGGPAVSHQLSTKQPGLGLSHDRLVAYQNELVNAANQAAAEGRFERKSSVTTEDPQSPELNGFDIHDYTQEYHRLNSMGAYEDGSDIDDDPLVAAANAEALANDEEGFYRREFGFLNGDGDADGLGRSVSGHNACREPNLTPITERSEFSTRNSFISLNTWNTNAASSLPGGGTFPGLGLAQIAAGLGNEDDMTLSQLIELRKKTFGAGGSTASLTGSTTSSPTSSTAAPFSVRNESHRTTAYNQLTAASDKTPRGPNKADGLSDHASSETSSPATTAPLVQQPFSPGSPSTSPHVPQLQSPIWPSPSSSATASVPSTSLLNKFNNRRSWQHRHSTSSGGQSSSSDSVAYVQEQDTTDPGVMRWVLERRRTEETGEVRVVGRTIVEGGRI